MIDLSHMIVSIDTQREGGMVMIRPHIENPTPLTLEYRMAISQHGNGGTSNISQQGEVRTGEVPWVVRLSVPDGGRCTVHLEVFQQGVAVGRAQSACDTGS